MLSNGDQGHETLFVMKILRSRIFVSNLGINVLVYDHKVVSGTLLVAVSQCDLCLARLAHLEQVRTSAVDWSVHMFRQQCFLPETISYTCPHQSVSRRYNESRHQPGTPVVRCDFALGDLQGHWTA